MTVIDKHELREQLLASEFMSIDEARRLYDGYLKGARLDRSESLDDHDRSQSAQSSNLAAQFEEQVHLHESHRRAIEVIDFGEKQAVVPGAVVKVNDRFFVVAVPTPVIRVSGVEVLGISTDAPLYQAMKGRRVGDTFEFHGRNVVVEAIL